MRLGERYGIASVYPDSQDIFQKVLGVESVSCRVLVEQLIRLGEQSSKDRDEIKKIIRMIGHELTSKGSVDDLRDAITELRAVSFLPVVGMDASPTYETPRGSFYVADNERYAAAFEGKVKILDFTYEELNSLHRFLDRLSLQGRYLSNHVRTSTEAENPTRSERLTKHLQQRSYALSWYV